MFNSYCGHTGDLLKHNLQTNSESFKWKALDYVFPPLFCTDSVYWLVTLPRVGKGYLLLTLLTMHNT